MTSQLNDYLVTEIKIVYSIWTTHTYLT